LNGQGRSWLDKTANQRFNRLHGARVYELLDEEHLQSLPGLKYDTRIPHLHKVNKDCLISYLGNFYSVPHIYACQTIELQDDGKNIHLLLNGKTIARHIKCLLKKGQLIINPDHYQGLKQHSRYVELIAKGDFLLTAKEPSQEGFDWLLAKYPGYFEDVQRRELDVYERVING